MWCEFRFHAAAGRNQFFLAAFLLLNAQSQGLLKMAYHKNDPLSTEAAVVIVGAALALFVGVFLFVANQYGGPQEAQVAQHATMPAPGNELPIAPVTPPAAPSVTPPTDTPPVTQ
jgi:hypothetical protein